MHHHKCQDRVFPNPVCAIFMIENTIPHPIQGQLVRILISSNGTAQAVEASNQEFRAVLERGKKGTGRFYPVLLSFFLSDNGVKSGQNFRCITPSRGSLSR